MAVSMKARVASCSAAAPKRQTLAVCHAAADNKASLAAVTLAAAAIIAAPAQAGVVLEQPALKKLFQDDAPQASGKISRPFRQPDAAPAPAAEKPAAAAPAPKIKIGEESSSEGGLDPRGVALPASIVAIAGLGFAASKIDGGFSEWLNESGALVRNSGNYAGFEEEIKGNPNYLGGAYATSPAAPARNTKKGTQKVGTQKKGTTFFGKK